MYTNMYPDTNLDYLNVMFWIVIFAVFVTFFIVLAIRAHQQDKREEEEFRLFVKEDGQIYQIDHRHPAADDDEEEETTEVPHIENWDRRSNIAVASDDDQIQKDVDAILEGMNRAFDAHGISRMSPDEEESWREGCIDSMQSWPRRVQSKGE